MQIHAEIASSVDKSPAEEPGSAGAAGKSPAEEPECCDSSDKEDEEHKDASSWMEAGRLSKVARDARRSKSRGKL